MSLPTSIITTTVMFTELFMRRALAVALLLSPLCALLGVFVTARKMSFFSDTIAHAALAGIAAGVWLGWSDPTIPMVAVSLLVASAILWLKENTDLVTDTIMALLLSGSVAVGMIILSMKRGSPGQIQGYLFGDILAVEDKDIWIAAAMFVIISAGVFWKLNWLALITAHEEMARVCGVPVRRMNYLFVVVLTLAVAVSIRLLGIILVTALVVIPPAAARNLSRNLRQHIWLSLLFGGLGGAGGTILSYRLNAPCGPSIVLVCIAIFAASLAGRRIRPPRRLTP